MSVVRGVEIEEVPTLAVRLGDHVACWLSDASAYLPVTGWSDRLLKLSRFGLADVVHRTFTVRGAPWWAGTDMGMLTYDVAGTVFIVARKEV
jgi:hypothetical protein